MNLIKGENAAIRRELLGEDEVTPILISSLTYLKAQVRQYNRLVVEYTLLPAPADPEISGTDNIVTVNLNQATSALLKEGPLSLRLLMKQTDTDYSDGNLYDIQESECFDVIL